MVWNCYPIRLKMLCFGFGSNTWALMSLLLPGCFFAVANTGFEKLITKKRIIILSIIPLGLFLSAETLGWLNIGHLNPRMETSGAFPIFTYDRNFFNYISAAYYSVCLLISTSLFTLMLFRSSKSSRSQALVYLLGSIPPC